jgi:excisionase family DNA binding protein
MAELLTARQVQDLLQVDRTTIYRMLNDGRLSGVKIGGQWRFHAQVVDALMRGQPAEPKPAARLPAEPLPLECIQPIQDVFAEIAGIGAVLTGLDGEPLTELSNCSSFCRLILDQPTGRAACIESWRRLAAHPEETTGFATCHAGLQYARGRVSVNDTPAAMLIAGQFYAEAPNDAARGQQIRDLAQRHAIDADRLLEAAGAIKVLDKSVRTQIGEWLARVAQVFSEVASERRNFLGRLRAIAEMTAIDLPSNN